MAAGNEENTAWYHTCNRGAKDTIICMLALNIVRLHKQRALEHAHPIDQAKHRISNVIPNSAFMIAPFTPLADYEFLVSADKLPAYRAACGLAEDEVDLWRTQALQMIALGDSSIKHPESINDIPIDAEGCKALCAELLNFPDHALVNRQIDLLEAHRATSQAIANSTDNALVKYAEYSQKYDDVKARLDRSKRFGTPVGEFSDQLLEEVGFTRGPDNQIIVGVKKPPPPEVTVPFLDNVFW